LDIRHSFVIGYFVICHFILYGLVIGELESPTASKGNVHYNERGKALQGEAVAKAVLDAMR